MQQTFMDRVKEINNSNKMSAVKKGQKAKLGPKKMPASMVEVTTKFKKDYPKRDLEVLWAALLKCYGTQALAEEAVRQNSQILNPSYTFCNTMLMSKEVLVGMMGEEEAMEVMMKNPAVLQCGPSLDTLGPDEIKGFANLRSFFNNLIPSDLVGPAIALLISFLLFPVFAVNNEALADSEITNIVKPIVGILFAVAIEGSRILIVGSIVKGKLSGDERLAQAAEAEARRMGKGKANGGKSFGEPGKKQWLGF